ncbi:MAG: hypothetical protein IKU15_00375 [Clostridia bacterium]|nr:hypothetical protein [Clostridia bacterium]MBR4889757.1 hypothetical protein [Clostridia bacterium]
MADISKLNGYNIKDAQARADIELLKQGGASTAIIDVDELPQELEVYTLLNGEKNKLPLIGEVTFMLVDKLPNIDDVPQSGQIYYFVKNTKRIYATGFGDASGSFVDMTDELFKNVISSDKQATEADTLYLVVKENVENINTQAFYRTKASGVGYVGATDMQTGQIIYMTIPEFATEVGVSTFEEIAVTELPETAKVSDVGTLTEVYCYTNLADGKIYVNVATETEPYWLTLGYCFGNLMQMPVTDAGFISDLSEITGLGVYVLGSKGALYYYQDKWIEVSSSENYDSPSIVLLEYSTLSTMSANTLINYALQVVNGDIVLGLKEGGATTIYCDNATAVSGVLASLTFTRISNTYIDRIAVAVVGSDVTITEEQLPLLAAPLPHPNNTSAAGKVIRVKPTGGAYEAVSGAQAANLYVEPFYSVNQFINSYALHTNWKILNFKMNGAMQITKNGESAVSAGVSGIASVSEMTYDETYDTYTCIASIVSSSVAGYLIFTKQGSNIRASVHGRYLSSNTEATIFDTVDYSNITNIEVLYYSEE